MHNVPNKFSTLFKKYRLRAEFSTLSELSVSLIEKGFIYEDSILSRWQNGDRVPQSRLTLIKLLEIFIERKAIVNLDQANGFLASAKQGYLSEGELKRIPIKLSSPVFQVPNEIDFFSGRQGTIKEIAKQKNVIGKTILIYGPAGVGKTALAIKLGHLLKDKFEDGVLWYKIEEDNTNDILVSIAHIFGEDISAINSKQVRATIVRSLLSGKNMLLFLDSAELSEDLNLLIPNSKFCTTIITSQKNHLKVPINFIGFDIKPFTNEEVLSLFKKVLQREYPNTNSDSFIKIAEKVGNLPLALHILARQMVYSKLSIVEISNLIKEENSFLRNIYDQDKNLYSTIAMSYEKLNDKMKSVLLSASIFKGKDFSVKSIGYINGLSISITTSILQSLCELSLIEQSAKNRYRIHPVIREFVREKLDNPRSYYLIIIAVLIFIFFTTWWLFLQLFVSKHNSLYQVFSATYSTMALYGAVCGIQASLNWGGLRTLLGKAIFMFSLGLFSQIFGQMMYSYYSNFQHIAVPYPSIGDIGYFGTIPFYTYGVWLLAKSSGIKIKIQSFQKSILLLIVPSTMFSIAYVIFLKDYSFDFKNPMKILLDFAYPLGEAIYISIAIVTFIFSRKVLDGIMRSKAFFVLVALVVQFIADYIFLSNPSGFYSGSYFDFIYLISYFIMTLALLNLKSFQVKIRPAN